MHDRLEEMNDFISQLRKDVSADRNYFRGMPIQEVISHCRFLSAAQYGRALQNYIRDKLGWVDSDTIKRGDWIDDNGVYREAKCSLVTDVNDVINIVHIRPWQEVEYFVFAADVRVREPFPIVCFELTKDQMLAEIEITSSGIVNGGIEANQVNDNVEYRIGIKYSPNNYIFNRWCECYKSDKLTNSLHKQHNVLNLEELTNA